MTHNLCPHYHHMTLQLPWTASAPCMSLTRETTMPILYPVQLRPCQCGLCNLHNHNGCNNTDTPTLYLLIIILLDSNLIHIPMTVVLFIPGIAEFRMRQIKRAFTPHMNVCRISFLNREFTKTCTAGWEGGSNLYSAASNVLGMGPPLGSPPAPIEPNYYSAGDRSQVSSPTSSYNSTYDTLNIGSGGSRSSLPSEIEMRPNLPRGETATSVKPTSVKSKAVDLSAPPYTKQYIDQYRQRIKGDPDPEAHFLYAKYLVDAARQIRTNAKDQRSAKKYSEVLIGEALKVIRRVATQGETYDEAQFYLANCYGTGALGLQVDHERAYHLYLQAAKQNHAAACYRVAVCNEIGAGTRREPPRAAAFYRKAASLGDTAAMYKLGMILLNGSLGEPKNPREAVGWLKRAAEQADEENPHALYELGLLHEMPNSGLVPHDPLQAKNLYTQAAHLGYTQAQYKLGQCYEYGSLTCPVDPRRSIAWYTKAAEKGDAEAELALSGWYLTGSEGVLKQSDSEAYLWARRAANKGLSKAEYAVGYYAEVGIGIKQDVEFAKRWYMRAAGE